MPIEALLQFYNVSCHVWTCNPAGISENTFANLFKFIENKLREREPYYLKAQITIEALNLNINNLVRLLIDFPNL